MFKEVVGSCPDYSAQVPRVVKAKMYIDLNLTSALTVDRISREAFFPLFHFIMLFKSIYGKTPHQYLKEKRSAGSFSTLFRFETGMSPREYKQEGLKRKNKIDEQPLRAIPGCFARKFNLLQE